MPAKAALPHRCKKDVVKTRCGLVCTEHVPVGIGVVNPKRRRTGSRQTNVVGLLIAGVYAPLVCTHTGGLHPTTRFAVTFQQLWSSPREANKYMPTVSVIAVVWPV
jgi:hypothetical protein